MLWKKGNERFALLIVAVVAVFGLFLMWQNAGDVTGFAAKKTSKAVGVKAAAPIGDPCKAAQQAYARAGCDKRLPPPQCAQLSQRMNEVCPQKTPAQPVPPPPPPPDVEPTCSDSDNGRVYDVNGFISGMQRNGRAYNNPDICKPSNIVIERYCDGTTPQVDEHPCDAGQSCENGACVVLCGNGRVDPTENCGTCLADAPCADERQVCQDNACVWPVAPAPAPDPAVQPFCHRGARYGDATTEHGLFTLYCNPATGNVTQYTCDPWQGGEGARLQQGGYPCGIRGCESGENPTGCCSNFQQSTRCEGNVLVNESLSSCDGQTRTARNACGMIRVDRRGGTYYPSACAQGDNNAACVACGNRACQEAWGVMGVENSSQCSRGSSDLGIVNC